MKLPTTVAVKCSVCRRFLRTPKCIAEGIGPRCAVKLKAIDDKPFELKARQAKGKH